MRISLIMFFSLSVIACDVQPWVKPYERAHLADKVMIIERDSVASSYLEHVYDPREGARGAGLASGGGCGCI